MFPAVSLFVREVCGGLPDFKIGFVLNIFFVLERFWGSFWFVVRGSWFVVAESPSAILINDVIGFLIFISSIFSVPPDTRTYYTAGPVKVKFFCVFFYHPVMWTG